MKPKSINTTQLIDIKGVGPKTEKSCPVMNRKMAPKIARNIQTVCILCNIFSDSALQN